jgi:NADH-quinone oxidoreductase subunit N
MEYTLLIVLAIVFLITLVSSNNFIMIFISIIGFSLNIYVLLMADVSYHTSLEAGIKYFYLSALSSGLLISGIWLAYVIFLTTDFAIIKFILNEWTANSQTVEYLGILQIMVYSIMYGFLFKLAAFPCHLWAPEIYQGSPNPVMAFFILPVKIATFAIFMRLITNVFHELYMLTSYLLWFSALTSMLWGCLGAFTEMQTKKFIAFSSINQMGFLLIGVTCATFLGIRATFIYLFIYIIMNLGFLQIFLTTVKVTRTKTWTIERTMYYLTDFQYFAQHNWSVSIILVIILFSMAGIPPLAGFFGKYFLFLAAMESGYFLLVIVGMLTSLVSTFYYIRIIKIMWFDQLDNIEFDKPRFVTLLTKAEQYPLKGLAFLLIMFFIFIDPIISFTNIMAISC